MTNGNGKPKRKTGRPKGGNGISKKLLKAVAVKQDVCSTAVAEVLGVTKQTAYKHLQKTDVKNAVIDARERALKKAGITLEKTFCKIGVNLRKKGGPDQRHAIDKSLMLLGEEMSEAPAGVREIGWANASN